jgi:uncharacterized repeat protein (TIGR02059 family)
MTTTARGRHRKLRRNILHTVIATTLLAGTFTVVDQTVSSQLSPASANTAGGNDTTWNSAVVTAGAPTSEVADTKIDTSGNIYVGTNNVVRKYSPSGSLIWTSPNVGAIVTAIALDASNNVLVGTDWGAGLLSANGLTWTKWASVGNVNVTAVAYQHVGQNASTPWYWVASDQSVQSQKLQPFYGNGTTAGGWGSFTGISTTSGAVTDMAVDANGFLHFVGSFPAGYGRINWSTTIWAITSYSAITTAISTNATNLALSSSGLVAFGGPSAMGRLRVFSTATAAGAETTTFGNLSSSSTVTAAITTNLAHRSSDIAYDSSGRLLVGGQTFGLKRIKTDGTLDSNFTTTIPSATTVRAISVHGASPAGDAGKIVVGLSASPWIQRLTPENVAPGTPPAPTAVATDRQATVTVAAAAGATPTSYTVTASPGGATCTVTGASGNCTITGLTNGTAYTFTTIARNGDAASSASVASSAVTPTRTAPTFVSATNAAAGNTIVLTYDVDLLASPLPTASMFTVQEGGVTKTVSTVAISGRTVTLTLSAAVEKGSTVTVAYQAPTSVDDSTANAAIQSLVGTDALSLSTTALATNSSTVDTINPTVVSGVVNADGRSVTLTFSEPMSTNTVGGSSGVRLTLTSSSGNHGLTTPVTVSGSTITFPLASNQSTIPSNATVTASYSPAYALNDTTNTEQTLQDVAGRDIRSFNNQALTNNSTFDNIAPVLSTSPAPTVSANGTTLTLTYNESLHASTAVTSNFTVKVGSETRTVSSVSTSGSTVVLTLAAPIGQGVTTTNPQVTVAYTAPASNAATTNTAVQDTTGNDAASFTATNAINNSAQDQTAPVLVTASPNQPVLGSTGTELTLTYNEALSSTSAQASNFVVTVAGSPVSVSSVSASGSTVVLTLATPVQANNSITVAYTAPTNVAGTSNNAIQDTTGNDAASFAATAVTNNSTLDTIAPVLITTGASAPTVSTNGTTLTLTYSEAVSSTLPSSSNFVIYVNGSPVTVSSVARGTDTSTIVVTLANPIGKQPGFTVTADLPAVSDLASNASTAATAVAVTNNSNQDQTPPVLSSASIGTSGTTLTLFYNESLNTSNKPAGSAFVVTVGGSPVSVSSVTVNGSTASLGLGVTVNAGQVVTVAYTPPTPDVAATNTAIQDTTGNDAASIANTLSVTNSSTQGPPVITGGTVAAAGTSVTLNFSKSINTYTMSGLPFTLYANGAPVKCSGFVPPTLSGCSPTIPTGAVVTATYEPLAGYTYGNGSESLQAASGVALTNNSTQPADVIAPSLTSITMPGTNGQTIVLTYDEAMGGVAPAANTFTVLVNGVASTVSSVSVVGQQVTLTLSPPIEAGQTVSLAYAAPSPANNWANVAAIQDVYGNDAISINTTSIVNTSEAVVDRTVPVLQSAATNTSGTQIILTYNESLSSTTAVPSDYSITLNGMTFSPTAVSISGSTVILTVGTNIVTGESVSVSYTAPTPSGATTNSAVQDLSGNDAVSLTNTTVTNNSNGQPDLTSPIVSSVAYSGTQVTLTLNEPLSSTSAGASQYTVFVGNTPVTPNAVTISGQTVVLTLPSSIPAGTIIAVSYTAPLPAASNTSNQALQDLRGNDAASFNTSTQSTGTSWEWVGGQPTQGCPSAGSAYKNSSKSKLLPNGVTYTVAVTGDYLCIDQATESLSQRGGQAGDFQSVGLVTEPGLMMWTSNDGCVANQLIGRCDNRGVMTISFSKPVTNPVVSFAGWGGGNNGAGWSEMQLLGGMNGTNAVTGARVTSLAGTNIQISSDGTVIGNVDGTVPAIYCHRTTGYGANAQAVCGSLQVEGVYTSVSFQVNFEYAASSTGSDGGNEDAWNLTASIPEDFGMVPTSYDNPVASHAIGSLKLGSALTADNPSSLYSTTNADAVAAGTEIIAGAKNSSNGDVVVDDGVAQSAWSGLMNNQAGQTFTIPLTIAGVAETANLCAWIDFNRDGVFTAGERSCASSVAVGQTSASITWTIPNDIAAGPTYARVRLSYDSLPLPSGKVGSGEVEDYSLRIASFAVPSATKDDSIGAKDVNQIISPLLNDTFESGVANDMAKMFLCLPTQTPMNCTIGTGQSLTIPGEGTYTLNANGTVTFDPVSTFTGTATPIKYQIADTQNRTSSSTINPVVIPTPTGVPDASSGDYDKDQIISPLSNDIRGSSNYPLVGSSIKLCAVDDPTTGGNEAQSPNSCSATSVTIPGEGTYTLNSDGTVTFNPLSTFYGTVATPVKYQAQDTLGQFENSTITPTVAQPPTATATNDISSGNYDTNQLIRPLENDSSGSNEQTLLPETVKLCNPSSTPPQTSPNCTLTSLTTADGTYTVNSDGTVTFNPLPTFTGTVATPVGYQVTDALGRKVSANITPTVGLPPNPSAAPETTTGPYNTAQFTTPLTNETPGSASFPLSQSALKLCAVDDPATSPANEAQSPNTCSATSVTIPGEGTYVYDATTGRITFTPLATFTGQATPIVYQTKDSLDRFVNSTYTPTVGTPPPPVAVANVSVGNYDQNQTITPLGNDTAGSAAFPISASTIRLCQVDDPATTPDNEAQTPNNCSVGVNGTVTIPGEGTYTLNSDGTVTFNPLPTFAGTVQTPLKYQVADTRGVIANSTITPTVYAPDPPTADPETTSGKKGATQTTDLLVGDATSDPDISLVASSVKLCNPATNEIAPNCTLTTLVAPNVGTYTVVNGVMTFTPLSTYVGTPDPVAYQVTDSMGGTATSTYTPTVIGTPTANPDTTSGAWKANQSINVVDNVTGNAGDDVAANGATLDATSVKISCASAANCSETIVNNVVTAVTIANQGTYTVDTATGVVTFDPLDTFTGQATPVTYTVSDNLGQTATSTYTPTVSPPAPPTADPETTTGSKGVAQTTDLLVGDSTSDPSITLVPSSVRLCPATTTAPQTSTACTLTTLTVAGVGTYTVVDGVMTFTPEANYVGTPPAVVYQVTDSLGAKASSTYIPTVVGTPTASPDTTTGAKGAVQEVSLVGNDNAASGATLDPTSVKLCDPNPTAEVAPNCTKTSVTVSGVGTYSVDSTGKMTFTPDANYVGTPPDLSYTVTDSLGAKASSTYTPTVIGTPTATPDTSSGPQGVAQSRNVVTNSVGTSDAAATGTTLVSSTVTLSCASAPNCTRNIDGTVTIDGQGTYSAAAANGTVVFTPIPTFTGTATPVTYTISDALGQSATTTYTPTVIPAPVAINDTSTNGQDKNQLINVLANDTVPTNPAGDPLNPASVKLCDPTTNPAQVAPNCTLTTLTTADGTYTVNPTTGVVTFDPIPSFTGTVSVPVRYQVSDTGSTPQVTSATITPTVIPGPTALSDTSSGPMNTAQTKTLVTNDSAATGATLDVASVKLCDPNAPAEVAPNCTKTSVTVPNVGTYAVDSSGVMTFTPVTGYSGTPAPLSYTVADNFGVKASSTYTPTVIPPPTLIPDTSTGPWDTNQTRNVVTNSVNTSDSAAAGTTLAAGSVRLCAPTDIAPNCTVTSGGSVVIANQGTYTLDPTTGIVTFDPLPTFTGTATPVTYSVTDALGQKSSTTYTPTVTVPPVPTATPDTVELIPGQSKVFSSIFDGTTGDTDPALATKGTGGPDLTNASVCLIDPATSICDTDGIVTITGQGTYTLNPTTGIVTYAALSSATPGAKTPVTYKITDDLGRNATSTLTPTITPPPVANPDFSTGVQGAIQTLSPVGNDRPGGGASTTLYPDTRAQVPSGIFLCAANQPPPDCAATTVIVNDANNVKLGVLTVAASGLVTFTPEPNFIGTTPPIGYQLPDNLGQMAYSTITITVLPPPAPSATLDTGSAEFNNPVTLRPWINDSAGAVPSGSSLPAPNLVATSIKLCGDNTTFIALAGTPADCAETKIKTVEGTYEVNATTGEVVFTPVAGFTGTVKYPPTYQIWNDWTGLGGVKSATALLVPTISPPVAPGGPSGPVATVDVTKTKPGTSVVLNPVANDKPGSAALDPATIRLCGASEISPSCTRMSVTTIDGRYVVEPRTGQVTFTPRDGFTGQATIPYIIKDGMGMQTASHLIITVEDSAVVKKPKKKTGLAKTGGHRPDMLLLLGILAMVGAGGLRVASRKR